ncbi:hypothetical protein T03_4215 [Trichinella britovi]|uniref:Uncharacterized protein n=1 Tax=Trichinella britovi TaxID=45882 RepID=A0A0V1BSH5_TRIBR|nr:hypothetical protein T03_4215 [Trichinella britovi]
MYTPDGHRVWCSAELPFIGDVGPDERLFRSTVEKTVDQPLLPVLTVGHRLNDRQEDPGSPNSRGEVDPDRSEFTRGSVRSRIFCFQTLGGCRCWLHPVAPRVSHFLKLLTAWFVCGSDDGGGSRRQAEGADLVDQDSAGSSLYGALFADIQNTTRVSGHIAIVPARRVRRIAGNSRQDGFRSTPRSFRLDPLVWWPS